MKLYNIESYYKNIKTKISNRIIDVEYDACLSKPYTSYEVKDTEIRYIEGMFYITPELARKFFE